MADQRQLIASLQEGSAYPHLAANIEVIETHISWVILTGIFAYKIKKELELGFLDFSTLQKRKHFCEEEMRLNRRWAPDLYLDVVPICGSAQRPSFGGGGPAIEYALKLRQFPQEAQLDKQLDAGSLSAADMIELGNVIASMHARAARIAFDDAETATSQILTPMRENFPLVDRATDLALLQRVEEWTECSVEKLADGLIARHQGGFVRECHGDLHLANLVRLSSGIVPFDCIEFSDQLRNVDVISDIAFLAMDLTSRARQDLASVFVNRYLERTGDYAGMTLFGLYFVYRCLIRAKVAAIRSAERQQGAQFDSDIDSLKHYLAVATRWIDRRGPVLVAMHGLSGSGKTWLSSRLLSRLPALRIRSDVERKRRLGLSGSDDTAAKPGEGAYTAQGKASVYRHLLQQAGGVLRAGFNVIIDASFLQRAERDKVAALAEKEAVPLVFVQTTAQQPTLLQRLEMRQEDKAEVSEADAAVLRYQESHLDQLSALERENTIVVATDADVDLDSVVKGIHRCTLRKPSG